MSENVQECRIGKILIQISQRLRMARIVEMVLDD